MRLGIRLRGLSTSQPRTTNGHLYVNAVECSVAATGDLAEFACVSEAVKGRPWVSLTLSGHSDGAHLNLGDVYICGLVGDEERRRDGEHFMGCTRTYCKKARPDRPAVHWDGTAAEVLALLGCNTMSLGGPVFPTTSSLVLSALLGGQFGNILAVHGSFPAFKGVERDFLDRVRSGARLGDVVNALNARADLTSYGSTIVLVGDPDYRLAEPNGLPTRQARPRGPATRPTSRTTLRPRVGLVGFLALGDFARRALQLGNRAGTLGDSGSAEVEKAIGEIESGAPDAADSPSEMATLMAATRRLRIDPIYFGPALRPSTAQVAVAPQGCPQCAATVLSWADHNTGHEDLWCVSCGHLSAGTCLPDLTCWVTRVGDELDVQLRSGVSLGSISILVRDECRGEDVALETLHGTGGEVAARLAIQSPPSEDAVSVHLLRHRSSAVCSYRALTAGLAVAQSVRLQWGDHAA